MSKLLATIATFTLSIASVLVSPLALANETNEQRIFIQDVDTFWHAYDEIVKTTDREKQKQLFKTLYLDKGTIGLSKLQRARTYTIDEYVDAINNYPKFWQAIRKETANIDSLDNELNTAIARFKEFYPALKPGNIYFAIGALRTAGTLLEGDILIGAELAFATKDTPTSEFPKRLSNLPPYFATNPKDGVAFLNIHEYIHTQQVSSIGYNLLAQTALEGSAEFLTEKVLNVKSPNPQIEFGRTIDAKVKAAFEKEMFSLYLTNWIWNSPENEFGMRDLGYYVGYRIAENVFNSFEDKKEAAKYLIEVDYNNEEELIKYVERSKYFTTPLAKLKEQFELERPEVTSVSEVSQNEKLVGVKTLTVNFSKPLDPNFRRFKRRS